MPSVASCDVLFPLVAEFHTAVRLFSAAVKELTECTEPERMHRQESLKQAVASAFQECAAAREAMQRHIVSHKCG